MTDRNHVKITLSIIIWTCLAGCKYSRDGSELQHGWGDLVNEQFPSAWWAEISYAELTTRQRDATIYPENHPAVQRLDRWVKAMSEAVGKTMQRRDQVWPRSYIEKSPDINGSVSDIMIELKNSVTIVGSNGENSKDHLDLISSADVPTFAVESGGYRPRIKKSLDGRQLLALAKFYFPQQDHSCLSIGANTANAIPPLIITYSCLSPNSKTILTGTKSAKAIKYGGVNQFIMPTDRKLQLGEESSVATFAHEMGHYLKAHSLKVGPVFQYPYF